MLKSVSFLLLILVTASLAGQSIYRVNQLSPAANPDGLSWNTAFPNLHQALAQAMYGDEIWIAQGKYLPSDTGDRSVSFFLKNGVRIYGGFQGSELLREERDPEAFPVILSGNIGAPEDKSDNSLHVLVAFGLDSTSVLDGLTIADGNSGNYLAQNGRDLFGAGLLLLGAFEVANTAPLINNCRFVHNEAQSGGAIYANWEDPGSPWANRYYVNPRLENCIFEFNRAEYQGGAIMKQGHTFRPQDTLYVLNCRFSDNWAFNWRGGGIVFHFPGASSIVLSHCVFERDTAIGGSGVYYNAELQETTFDKTIIIDNCTFSENYGLDGAFTYSSQLTTGQGEDVHCRITHSSFKNNKTFGGNGTALFFGNAVGGIFDLEMRHCDIIGNRTVNGDIVYIGNYGGIFSTIKLESCRFLDNRHPSNPDAITTAFNILGGASSFDTVFTRIENCLFANNGGGFTQLTGPNTLSRAEIVHSTFFNNNQYVFWKSSFDDFPWFDTTFSTPNNRMHLSNCIIWEPRSDPNRLFYNNYPSGLHLGYWTENCLFYHSKQALVSYIGSVYAFDQSFLYQTDPKFVDTLAGDFRLQACSPAQDSEFYHFVTPDAAQMSDLDGLPRVRFGKKDIGAYEIQDSCAVVSAPSPLLNASLHLWPNPGTGNRVYFSIPEPSGATAVCQVTDQQGRLKWSGALQVTALNHIEVAGWPAGPYFIRIRCGQKQYTGRFLMMSDE